MNEASASMAWGKVSQVIGRKIATTLEGIEKEVTSRAYRASNELRNASLYVLRGERSGKRYKIPGTYRRQKDNVTGKMRNGVYYTASKADEPPAVRTGIFRLSWGTHVRVEKQDNVFRAVSAIESNVKVGKYLLGDLLEDGTKRMASRPYKQAIRDMAMPKIQALYKKQYKI